MSLASALGLDNEIALIKSRGFPCCQARTLGGPDGKFRVGTQLLDAAGVRALANRLADRFPANPYLPRPVFAAEKNMPHQKEQSVPDIFRGLTERQVRDDLTTIRDEWGGPAKAAQVLDIGKSTLVNAIGGHAKIGNTVMDALYGPEGTTLRADIRKRTENPDGQAGEDAGSEPALQICTTAELAALVQPKAPTGEDKAHEAAGKLTSVPDWMAPAVEALRQKRTAISQQVWELEQQLDKINAAERALLDLAA